LCYLKAKNFFYFLLVAVLHQETAAITIKKTLACKITYYRLRKLYTLRAYCILDIVLAILLDFLFLILGKVNSKFKRIKVGYLMLVMVERVIIAAKSEDQHRSKQKTLLRLVYKDFC
jgi:hypothetical protein